jgi:hypothetical protein
MVDESAPRFADSLTFAFDCQSIPGTGAAPIAAR